MKYLINRLLRLFNLRLSRVKHGALDAYSMQQSLFKLTNTKCKTIFDIGANVGNISIRYRRLFPDAFIHSFEPFPETFNTLTEKVANDKSISINQLAISNSPGEEKFFVNHIYATNSLLERPWKGKPYYPENATAKAEITVHSTSINEYVKKNSISHIDILKMDIQGGELRALQGATELLKTGAIFMIYTEVMYIPHYEKSPMMYEIWSFLAKYGYSLFNVYNNSVAKDGQLRQGDAIFISPHLRELFDKV